MILISVKARRFRGALALLVVLGASACGSAPGDDARPRVVTSTTVLGDLVAAVAGGDAEVEVLLPIGVDPHDFSPSAQQIARIAAADLVVLNGLGLEERLVDAITGAIGSDVTILEVAAAVDPLPWSTDGSGGSLDPHVWLDPVRMAEAAGLVATALAAIDPGGDYLDRGEAYATTLFDTDHEIERILAVVPPERRLLVTNHEAFAYFAARYGFEVVGVVIPGGSTLAEPSSAELAALVRVIRDRAVPAIFAETTQPADLAAAIAAEAGTNVAVVELYSESLGELGSPAATLPGMLLENARRIAAALGG
jgi:zinc/manganese transport system substrate-binding protein